MAKVEPGEPAGRCNMGNVSDSQTPKALTAAARVYREKISGQSGSAGCRQNPRKSRNRRGGSKIAGITSEWVDFGKTNFLNFENNPDGIKCRSNGESENDWSPLSKK